MSLSLVEERHPDLAASPYRLERLGVLMRGTAGDPREA